MRDTRLSGKFAEISQIPVVIADERLLVGVLRLITEDALGLFDGNERVLAGRFVDPLVERRELQRFQDAQCPDGWGRRAAR